MLRYAIDMVSLWSSLWSWWDGGGDKYPRWKQLATSGQYLRAGGGCSSLLIRRKSSTDDEFHHADMVGVFGVLTNGTGGLLQNNLSDAFAVPQYVTQNAQILSKQIAVCMVAVAEPDMQSSPSGGTVACQARALSFNNKKSKKSHLCKCGCYGTNCHYNRPWPYPSTITDPQWCDKNAPTYIDCKNCSRKACENKHIHHPHLIHSCFISAATICTQDHKRWNP